jgi:hypothetical protein
MVDVRDGPRWVDASLVPSHQVCQGEMLWTDKCRWDQLRADKGWAALQYQVLLRSTLTVPSIGTDVTPITIDLIQGTEFALVPSTESEAHLTGPITWYNGDVYDFASSPTGSRSVKGGTSNFARSLAVVPGEYTVLVRAMYEIRMFGDPGMGKVPIIRLKLAVEIDGGDDRVRALDKSPGYEGATGADEVTLVEGLAEVPDVVDGWLMGDWASVALRCRDGTETVLEVLDVEAKLQDGPVLLTLSQPIRIVEGQLRPIAVGINQRRPLCRSVGYMDAVIRLSVDEEKRSMVWRIPLRQQETSSLTFFTMTFASPSSAHNPPAFISHARVVPPSHPKHSDKQPPVILALHGAGVDVDNPFWAAAIPAREGGWAVLPTGKNEWGEDWHGASMADVWTARDGLAGVLSKVGITVSKDTV